MRFILFSFSLLLFSCGNNYQSETLQALVANKQVRTPLELSPSTLRMINFQRDTAYDKMVEGVDKLAIFILNPNRFSQEDYYDTTDKLMQEEGFEEYMNWEGEDYQLNILGNQDKNKMIGLAFYQTGYYVFDLTGTIDLTQLPAMYESMSKQAEGKKGGFSYILDMFQSDENRRRQQEKRRKEREERKQERAAEEG